MNVLFLAFFLIVFAGFFGGSWGLGMKYMKPLAFEAWWLVYAFVALLLVPLIWALTVIPNLWGAIFIVPSGLIWSSIAIGIVWGASNILFGYAVRYIGVSITYGIVMGLGALMGSIVPLFLIPDSLNNPAIPYIFAGVLILLTGIAIVAIAGIRRDRLIVQPATTDAGDINKEKNVRIGIVLAVICGLLGSLMNIGFAHGVPIARAAESLGALTRNSTMAIWVVVCAGAFITNCIFALTMMTKNKTWDTYRNPGFSKAILGAILTGLGFFVAAGIYGQGAFLLGEIGPVVGWPIHLSVVIIISNFWGLKTGEWKGAMGPFRLVILSVSIFVIACFILGYANKLFYS
jgi:L-rhamnose-H+ transport protein